MMKARKISEDLGILIPTSPSLYDVVIGSPAILPTSIYNPKNVISPMCMYFYYIVPSGDGTSCAVKAFYYDNGTNPIVDKWGVITDLTINAREDSFTPPPYAQTFDTYPWRRKSYLAFVLDSDKWTFVKNGAFEISEKYNSKDNHSFFDGEDKDISVSPTETISGVCCKNYMCDKNGNPLGDNIEERFAISIYVTDSPGNQVRTTKIDPGGDNLGPPVGPPY